MARITFDIPDNRISRIVDAFAKKYNYMSKIEQLDPDLGKLILIDNPETKSEFTRRMITNYILSVTYDEELAEAKRSVDITRDISIS